MLENLLFVSIIIFSFFVGVAVLLAIDFALYAFFNISFLCALEKFIFERFGK